MKKGSGWEFVDVIPFSRGDGQSSHVLVSFVF